MKRIFYFVAAIALGAASCSQDLDQHPPFNYPESGSGGGGVPMPENCIMRMTFEDNLDVDGPHDMLAKLNDGDALFAEGHTGKAYQGAAGKAIVINPLTDAAGLKNIGSFTLTFWINFDGSNTSGTTLFAFSHPSLEIGNFALFLEGHGDPAAETDTFFFKGFLNEGHWFDGGDAAKIKTGIKDTWAQIGFVYDGASETATLYHNGAKLYSTVYKDFGPFKMQELNGLVIGAFPSMVGLSNVTDSWPATSSFYTGRMDELYLYKAALSDTAMTKQYQDQM